MPNMPPTVARMRRRTPRRAGNYYLKITGFALVAAVGVYAAWAFAVKIIHPYQMGWKVAQDVKKVENELRRQHAQNALLEKRLAYLKTPEGAETEARRAGFARPGEQVYLIRPAKTTK
ncbi:MAG: septum formation initiator family protein [Akkermansiaceae bacterium]|nr:septum formation initiator family protein [Armatimonadota bacterium]